MYDVYARCFPGDFALPSMRTTLIILYKSPCKYVYDVQIDALSKEDIML